MSWEYSWSLPGKVQNFTGTRQASGRGSTYFSTDRLSRDYPFCKENVSPSLVQRYYLSSFSINIDLLNKWPPCLGRFASSADLASCPTRCLILPVPRPVCRSGNLGYLPTLLLRVLMQHLIGTCHQRTINSEIRATT